jgi:hypothetical protein
MGGRIFFSHRICSKSIGAPDRGWVGPDPLTHPSAPPLSRPRDLSLRTSLISHPPLLLHGRSIGNCKVSSLFPFFNEFEQQRVKCVIEIRRNKAILIINQFVTALNRKKSMIAEILLIAQSMTCMSCGVKISSRLLLMLNDDETAADFDKVSNSCASLPPVTCC